MCGPAQEQMMRVRVRMHACTHMMVRNPAHNQECISRLLSVYLMKRARAAPPPPAVAAAVAAAAVAAAETAAGAAAAAVALAVAAAGVAAVAAAALAGRRRPRGMRLCECE